MGGHSAARHTEHVAGVLRATTARTPFDLFDTQQRPTRSNRNPRPRNPTR